MLGLTRLLPCCLREGENAQKVVTPVVAKLKPDGNYSLL